MGRVKCFDVADGVICDATNRFGIRYEENEKRKSELRMFCSSIDSIAELFDGESYEVVVDDETMDITISVVCAPFEREPSCVWFYDLIQGTKQTNISHEDEDHIRIDFVFAGIWFKVL